VVANGVCNHYGYDRNDRRRQMSRWAGHHPAIVAKLFQIFRGDRHPASRSITPRITIAVTIAPVTNEDEHVIVVILLETNPACWGPTSSL
jgi:hypothetical protein